MTGIENAVASCCLEGRDPENSIAGEMIALLLELVLKIASCLLAAPPFLSSLCSPGDGGEIPGVPPRLISYLFPYCVSCFVTMSLKASCSALSSHRGQSSALTTRRGRVRRSRCCFLSFPLHATGSQEKKIEKKKSQNQHREQCRAVTITSEPKLSGQAQLCAIPSHGCIHISCSSTGGKGSISTDSAGGWRGRW